MAPPVSKVDINSAEESRSQSKHKNVKRVKSKVQQDAPSSAIKIAKSHSSSPSFSSPKKNSPAMIRAREIQSSLGTEFPSCIKTMVGSHVTSGHSMGLPASFCNKFLRNVENETMFVLEDESGERWEVKYISNKGLSAGWKKLSRKHNLVEDDVLIFQLVEAKKFKVFVIKANDWNEIDAEQTAPASSTIQAKGNDRPESLSLALVPKRRKMSTPIRFTGNCTGNGNLLEGSGSSEPASSFQQAKTFQDFHILFKGVPIDHEFPDDIRLGYYRLCNEKKQYLHDGIPERFNDKLVVGMIDQTVSIAHEIKNSSLTTTKEEFQTWDRELGSFEELGMNVGFLRDRIHRLATFLFESEYAVDLKSYTEAKHELERVDREIQEILKVVAILERKKLTAKKIKEKAENFVSKFKETAQAPW